MRIQINGGKKKNKIGKLLFLKPFREREWSRVTKLKEQQIFEQKKRTNRICLKIKEKLIVGQREVANKNNCV